MNYTLEDMIKDGCTERMANVFYSAMQKEKESQIWSDECINWAHSNGFLAESASAYNLTDKNMNEYLSDYNYYKLWPFNSWQRIWINDKLTLKYMLDGTEFHNLLPRYYFYVGADRIYALLDSRNKNKAEENDIVNVLKEEKALACKPCNGAASLGFFKLSYSEGNFFINDVQCGKEEIFTFIRLHTNYIYTQYLYPVDYMAKISPVIHTIRLQVINDDGCNPFLAGGYLRFGTKDTGAANLRNNEVSAAFDYDVKIDLDTGEFGHAMAIYVNRIEDMPFHPDSREETKGKVENWKEITDAVIGIANRFNMCEYMAFDMCVSSGGIKIMEINSHGGIKHLQVRNPLLRDERSRKYYEKKLALINNMTAEEKEARCKTVR